MSNSLTPRPAAHQALSPWDSPGKNTGVGCHFLLQGIFPTQESNLHLSLKSPALAGGFFTSANSHGQRKPSGRDCRSLRQEATVCPPEAADGLQGDLFHLSSTAITAEQLFFTCECRLCVCGTHHTHSPPWSTFLSFNSIPLTTAS